MGLVDFQHLIGTIEGESSKIRKRHFWLIENSQTEFFDLGYPPLAGRVIAESFSLKLPKLKFILQGNNISYNMTQLWTHAGVSRMPWCRIIYLKSLKDSCCELILYVLNSRETVVTAELTVNWMACSRFQPKRQFK